MRACLLIFLALAGCQTVPQAAFQPMVKDVAELEARPDYLQAQHTAPDWVADALTRLALRDHALNLPPQ